MPLTEERVREIADDGNVWIDALEHGHGQGCGNEPWPSKEAQQLAADWLALRAQNAALRQMVEEAVVALNERCNDWERDEVVGVFRARLAALGEP